MTDNQLKAGVGLVLFATWVAFVVCKVPGADDLIQCIKGALLGLGFYHMADSNSKRQPPTQPGA